MWCAAKATVDQMIDPMVLMDADADIVEGRVNVNGTITKKRFVKGAFLGKVRGILYFFCPLASVFEFFF